MSDTNGNGRGSSFAVCEEMTFEQLAERVAQGKMDRDQKVLVPLAPSAIVNGLTRVKCEKLEISAHGGAHWKAASL